MGDSRVLEGAFRWLLRRPCALLFGDFRIRGPVCFPEPPNSALYSSGQSGCIVVTAPDHRMFEAEIRIAECLNRFMELKSPDEALAFANEFGFIGLGPANVGCYFDLQNPNQPIKTLPDWLRESETVMPQPGELSVCQLAIETLNAFPRPDLPDLPEINQHNLSFCLHGEPIEIWLWHAERLRVWAEVVGPGTSDRRVRDLLERPANYEPELPWRYHLSHDAPPSSYDSIGGTYERVLNPKSEARSIMADRIALGVQQTVDRHLGFVPSQAPTWPEVIVPDSLLTALYLEFSQRHLRRLQVIKSTRTVTCEKCGRPMEEKLNARGRKRFCSDACRMAHTRLLARLRASDVSTSEASTD